jgi:hypothetical protein
MRNAFPTALALLLMAGAASAKTFQLTYTGGRLRHVSQYHGIPGEKKLVFVITSNQPFPKNTCFGVPLSEVTSFTDGVDTIATLTAAGYILSQNSFFSLCSDTSGQHIRTWQIAYGWTAPSQYSEEDNTYEVTSFYPEGDNGFYDQSSFVLAEHNGYKTLEMEDVLTPGTWRYKVLK